MQTFFFTIIIPSLNEEKTLPHLLLDLQRQTFTNFEVYVIDAHSDDQTHKKISPYLQKNAHFHVIQASERNVSVQRNMGQDVAKGEYLLFLDSDSRVSKEFLLRLSKQLSAHLCDSFSCYAKADRTDFNSVLFINLQNIALDTATTMGAPYALGACLGCKKNVFKIIGGFDSKIHHMEDSEFVKRICEAGFTFKIFRSPRFTYSLRRQRQEGTFTMIAKLFPYYLKSVLKNEYSTPPEVYQMNGGEMFREDDKE